MKADEKPRYITRYINPYSTGPCYYYRLHNGCRILFRLNEIKSVIKAQPSGGVVITRSGCMFRVFSVFAEKVTGGES